MPTEIAGTRLYSLQEVADGLGVHYQTVKAWRAEGKIKALKIGRAYRVMEDELQRFLSDREAAVVTSVITEPSEGLADEVEVEQPIALEDDFSNAAPNEAPGEVPVALVTSSEGYLEAEEQGLSESGNCPTCGHEGEVLNIGRVLWGFCREHGVKWELGYNFYPAWRAETEEHWLRNREFLDQFKTVVL
jgi:excisionase family DNA binding protein